MEGRGGRGCGDRSGHRWERGAPGRGTAARAGVRNASRRVRREDKEGKRKGWGKGDDGEGGKEAGEEVRRRRRQGRRAGEEKETGPRRLPQRGLRGYPPPPSRRRSVESAPRRGLPRTHLGAPAPDPVPRAGSSFPPCPCDFSAPESRSLLQVPPAASSPRGTPGASPLPASHWLLFTPVTLPLVEGSSDMQIRIGPPPHRLAGAREA